MNIEGFGRVVLLYNFYLLAPYVYKEILEKKREKKKCLPAS